MQINKESMLYMLTECDVHLLGTKSLLYDWKYPIADEKMKRDSLRHSLANITEAWRGVATFRGGPLSSLKSSSSSALDFHARHEFLEKIQIAIIQLFHKKKLEEGELSTLQDHVRHFVKTEAGPLLYDYYKEKILRKGMVIIRDNLKNESGYPLLQGLCDQWKYFYEMLPTLQAMLYPIKTKDLSIRQVTLLEFRDIVLLKLEISGLLDSFSQELPKNCKQMLLVLQGIHESSPPSINFLRMEKLIARVIVPFLGTQGLYTGGTEPSIKANVVNTEVKEKQEDESEDESDTERRPLTQRSPLIKNSKLMYHKPGNGLALAKLLAPVVEHETGRRHSVQT
ncbi:hypothetical protein ScPMuIL_011909 [Solemya velum]